MGTISLRLPDSLHKQLPHLAKKKDVSINQFITTALAEKLSALMTEDYLAARAKRGDREKFQQALSRGRRYSGRRTRQALKTPTDRRASSSAWPDRKPFAGA